MGRGVIVVRPIEGLTAIQGKQKMRSERVDVDG